MSDTFYDLAVNVREYGGAYIARCEGKTASSTSARENAMRAAAAKAINARGKLTRTVTEAEITIRKRTGDRDGLFRAQIPVAEAEEVRA